MEIIKDFENDYFEIRFFAIFRAVVHIKGSDDLSVDEIEALREFISKQMEVTTGEVENFIAHCRSFYSKEQAFDDIRDYDQEAKQYTADFITEFFIAEDRDEDEKERLLEVFRECELPMPQNDEYRLDFCAGNDKQEDNPLVCSTYIAIHYDEAKERKIPGDYRKYTPCRIEFLQDQDQLGDRLNYCYNTPDLNRITESLDLSLFASAFKMNPCVAILFDRSGTYGYNKIMGDTNLTGIFPRVFVETCFVAIIDKDNPSDWNKILGFINTEIIRKVLHDLDKIVHGLAFDGPVYDQPVVRRRIEKDFWDDVDYKLDGLKPFALVEGYIVTERERKDRIKRIQKFKSWLSEKQDEEEEMQVREVVKACTFKKVVVMEEGVFRDGELRLVIYADFNIQDCKGEKCACCAYFYDHDGTPMAPESFYNDRTPTPDDARYSTASETQLVSTYEFTPSYNNSDFSDVELSIPMRLLESSARVSGNREQPYWIKLKLFNFATGEFMEKDSDWLRFYLQGV